MLYPDVLTGAELVDILEEGMSDSPEFIAEVRGFIEETPSELGYGVAETTCAYCGGVSFAVYAIPSVFPTECPYCKQEACYVTAVPGEVEGTVGNA